MMGRGVTGPRVLLPGRGRAAEALSAPSATAATPSTSSAGRTGTWTVSPLSAASGLLDELEDSFYSAPTDHIPFPAQEPPGFTWRGEADGVKLELWPEAELRVQSAYIEGYEVQGPASQ